MKKVISLWLIVTGIALNCYAQDENTVEIDLAALYNKDLKDPIPTGLKSIKHIRLKNVFPNRQYTIDISEQAIMHAPLDFSGAVTASKKACDDLGSLYKATNTFITDEKPAKKETELQTKTKELIEKAGKAECDDPILKEQIRTLVASTIWEFPMSRPVEIKSGSSYIITVTAGEKKWTYTLTGHTTGRWVVNYGFLFSPRGWEPEQYYLKQLAADSFRINKKRGINGIDLRFTPTVFFSYFLDKNLSKSWNNSLSAGLGFNTESPVVSLGYNGMYEQNIGFSIGVVFYQQKMLNGRYNEGDIVKESLDDDQLYDNTYFRPNIFFAINIRLGQNPFKKEEKK